MRCGFCVRGECWYRAQCLRRQGVYTEREGWGGDLDSDYAPAESGDDSADEHDAGGAEGPMHECVEDALPAASARGMHGSQNFLTTDWECCIKGWKPRADAPIRAPVGEAGLFGVLGQGFAGIGGD